MLPHAIVDNACMSYVGDIDFNLRGYFIKIFLITSGRQFSCKYIGGLDHFHNCIVEYFF
jgi:hypothetical protein